MQIQIASSNLFSIKSESVMHNIETCKKGLLYTMKSNIDNFCYLDIIPKHILWIFKMINKPKDIKEIEPVIKRILEFLLYASQSKIYAGGLSDVSGIDK